jgi:hypothetical protein
MDAKQILSRSIVIVILFTLLAGLGVAPASGAMPAKGSRAPAAPGGVCDNTTPVQWPTNGHRYLAVCAPERITWQAASEAAAAQGGHLATLTTAEENAFVYGLVNYDEFWWLDLLHEDAIGPAIGGFQPPGSPEPAGNWQWVTGEPWSYTSWAVPEPNNVEGDDRLIYQSRTLQRWSGWGDIPGTSMTWAVKGYIIEWEPKVLVQDEEGQPVPEAQVFRNGELAGATDSNGVLFIPDLAFDDKLVARKLITDWGTVKGHHSQDSDHNWAYRTYITSLEIPQNGEPQLYSVLDPGVTQTLTLKVDNTLIGFNVVASVEWDATAAYLNELRDGFELASKYLYDASDGQMLFEQVTIYDNAQAWNDADYQFKATNQQIPQAWVGVIPHGNRADRYATFGRHFNRFGATRGAWTQPDGYRTFVHEFGHYGLALLDSYFRYDAAWKKIDAHCTSAAIRTNATPGINATLMYYQFNATEFAMKNVPGLWSNDCLLTWQYQVGGSDWETILSFYADKNNPARWTLKTPDDYGGVVAGPTAIPVDEWSQVAEPVNVDNAACAAPFTLTTMDGEGNVITNTVTTLIRTSGDGRTIQQGASDANGVIEILGGGEGDDIHVAGVIDGKPASGDWDVTCPAGDFFFRSPSESIILTPDPFSLSVSVWPGSITDTISITVQTTATLALPPQVFVQQTGLTTTLPVTLTFDGGLWQSSAALDANWPQVGVIGVVATNTLTQTVTSFLPFNVSEIDASEDSRVWSSDGRAELYLPAGALSANGRVNISPEGIPGPAPDGMMILGSPYTIRAGEGVTLTGWANLSLFYDGLGDALVRVRLFGAALYRWDGVAWQALDSTFDADQQYAAAPIDDFGTYVLMTSSAPIFPVYLPVIVR